MRDDTAGEAIACLFFVAMFFAWLTHVFACLTQGEWGFLIAGALFFPVAIIHGIGLWFGVWG
jgi:hypothetical protein